MFQLRVQPQSQPVRLDPHTQVCKRGSPTKLPHKAARTVRASATGEVPELAHYLEQVEIYAPSVYHHLAIFPVRLRGSDELRGAWLTLDQALARGSLRIMEIQERLVPLP